MSHKRVNSVPTTRSSAADRFIDASRTIDRADVGAQRLVTKARVAIASISNCRIRATVTSKRMSTESTRMRGDRQSSRCPSMRRRSCKYCAFNATHKMQSNTPLPTSGCISVRSSKTARSIHIPSTAPGADGSPADTANSRSGRYIDGPGRRVSSRANRSTGLASRVSPKGARDAARSCSIQSRGPSPTAMSVAVPVSCSHASTWPCAGTSHSDRHAAGASSATEVPTRRTGSPAGVLLTVGVGRRSEHTRTAMSRGSSLARAHAAPPCAGRNGSVSKNAGTTGCSVRPFGISSGTSIVRTARIGTHCCRILPTAGRSITAFTFPSSTRNTSVQTTIARDSKRARKCATDSFHEVAFPAEPCHTGIEKKSKQRGGCE